MTEIWIFASQENTSNHIVSLTYKLLLSFVCYENGKKYLKLGLHCIYLTVNEIAGYWTAYLFDWTSYFAHAICEPPRRPATKFLSPINAEVQQHSFLMSSRSTNLTITPLSCSSTNFP